MMIQSKSPPPNSISSLRIFNTFGFNAEGPYIEYIKLKNFCLSGVYDDSNLDTDEILDIFKTGKPFLDYINRAIEFSREEEL